ncbi:MBL fold metallo-hydrolase [Lachnospiraceae bacterium LCP25S3_G4]
MIKVTFIAHSGFMVELEQNILIFDYYKGDIPRIKTKKAIYVFASHAHYDHYVRDIYRYNELSLDVTFVLSDDIPREEVEVSKQYGVLEEQVKFLEPDIKCTIGNCKILTLKSTDEGVAFLVTCEDKVIYHAGDLNWWHWEEESEIFNAMMKKKYQTELNKISSQMINIAFVPLDPRLGDAYLYGIDYFMRHTNTNYVVPMHCWEQYDICDQLMQEDTARDYKEHVIPITHVNQTFVLETVSCT